MELKEEEKTYEFGLIVGTKREREYWKNKIREKKDYYHNIAFERKDVKPIKITQALAIYKAMCDLLKEE